MRSYDVAVGLMVGLLTAGSASADRGSAAYKTPEQCFQAAQKATAQGDWKTFVGCLSPETLDRSTAMMIMMGAMSQDIIPAGAGTAGKDHFKEVKEPLAKVLAKHGITTDVLKKMADDKVFPDFKNGPPQPDFMAKIAAAVKQKDRPAFLADVMGTVSPLLAKDNPDKTSDFLANKELKDLKVDGDKAEGMMVTVKDGTEQPNPQPIMFLRMEGSWRILMPIMGGGKATKPPEKPNPK